MATLKDIAQKAGISQGAVSRILNKDKKLSVSETTKEKVFRIANELGYKSLSSRRAKEKENHKLNDNGTPRRIGIASMHQVNELAEDIFYLLLKNIIDAECFSMGWTVVMLNRDKEEKFVKNDQLGLDGIIGIGSFDKDEIESLLKYTDSIVFIDSSPDDSKYSAVVTNYKQGIKCVIDEFHNMGYDKIAYIGECSGISSEKFNCYKEIMTENNNYDEKSIVKCELNSTSSYKALSEYLDERKILPKAIFVSSDVLAGGVIRALRDKNFSIPDDVSIIAFNNTMFSKQSMPALDSIDVHMKEMAEAATICMGMLWKDNKIPRKIVIPCFLEKHGSVRKNKIH